MTLFRNLFIVFCIIAIVEFVIIVRKNILRKIHRAVRSRIAKLPSQLRNCNSDKEIYDRILTMLVSLFPSTVKGSFLIIDKEKPDQMHFVAIHNLNKNLLGKIIPTEKCFSYLHNKMRDVAIVDSQSSFYSLYDENDAKKSKDKSNPVCQTLMAPIYFEEKVYGVVNLTTVYKGRFKKSDIALCKYILYEINMILEYFITKSRMNYVIEYDSLTKIHSRDTFLQTLESSMNSLKENEELVFVMIDLDNFKEINDTYGHLAGDKALSFFSDILRQNIEPQDDCGRYGGDEFGILLKNSTMISAMQRMKKVQECLNSNAFNGISNIEFSYGAVSIKKGDHYSLHDVIEKADANMYQSKGVKVPKK